jgi:hypothetical protein
VFARERLHTLLWANTYDLRGGEPRWWHGVLGQRRGGAAPANDVGDLVLPDGRAAWVDGGPRGPLATPLTGRDDLPIVHRESVALGRLTVQGDAAPQEALAPDQLAAVTHRAGPARIIAPAGSGKTRVLTARLRHLLRDRTSSRSWSPPSPTTPARRRSCASARPIWPAPTAGDRRSARCTRWRCGSATSTPVAR